MSCAGADDEHLDKILEAAARLPFISAIILVANGSVARETITIKNVFTLLRGHMPDAVMENTLAVLTNCTSITRCVYVLSRGMVSTAKLYILIVQHNFCLI